MVNPSNTEINSVGLDSIATAPLDAHQLPGIPFFDTDLFFDLGIENDLAVGQHGVGDSGLAGIERAQVHPLEVGTVHGSLPLV